MRANSKSSCGTKNVFPAPPLLMAQKKTFNIIGGSDGITLMFVGTRVPLVIEIYIFFFYYFSIAASYSFVTASSPFPVLLSPHF